jgi:hypothetical protein
MMLAVASVGVTASAHSAVRATITTPQPAIIAPQNPDVGTPSGITLLPYVQLIGPGATTRRLAP